MQTFLPYPDFFRSAMALDKKRCWKQVVEAKQILCVLRAEGLPAKWVKSASYKNQRWFNHPAVQMWGGYEEALKDYFNQVLFVSVAVHKINTKMKMLSVKTYDLPWWINNASFHKAMRSRLIQKDSKFYSKRFLKSDRGFNKGKYFWPDNHIMKFKTI